MYFLCKEHQKPVLCVHVNMQPSSATLSAQQIMQLLPESPAGICGITCTCACLHGLTSSRLLISVMFVAAMHCAP